MPFPKFPATGVIQSTKGELSIDKLNEELAKRKDEMYGIPLETAPKFKSFKWRLTQKRVLVAVVLKEVYTRTYVNGNQFRKLVEEYNKKLSEGTIIKNYVPHKMLLMTLVQQGYVLGFKPKKVWPQYGLTKLGFDYVTEVFHKLPPKIVEDLKKLVIIIDSDKSLKTDNYYIPGGPKIPEPVKSSTSSKEVEYEYEEGEEDE